ncbi:MAG: type II toxin-antitoxin system prevent-host-death family antitoxin [Candidatus Peribacteraceae bacterium]|nr:type II toxin-antitoxin system prevent-host-death family antitoxin [Candidatus Peribacteraceae bacterium]
MNNTITYSAARQNLKGVLDKVCKNCTPVFIQRRNGGNVVVLSESDFNSLDETAYLNTSPANRKHLQKSLAQLKKGEVIETSIDSL